MFCLSRFSKGSYVFIELSKVIAFKLNVNSLVLEFCQLGIIDNDQFGLSLTFSVKINGVCLLEAGNDYVVDANMCRKSSSVVNYIGYIFC